MRSQDHRDQTLEDQGTHLCSRLVCFHTSRWRLAWKSELCARSPLERRPFIHRVRYQALRRARRCMTIAETQAARRASATPYPFSPRRVSVHFRIEMASQIVFEELRDNLVGIARFGQFGVVDVTMSHTLTDNKISAGSGLG
jgi:hypothetical protein